MYALNWGEGDPAEVDDERPQVCRDLEPTADTETDCIRHGDGSRGAAIAWRKGRKKAGRKGL